MKPLSLSLLAAVAGLGASPPAMAEAEAEAVLADVQVRASGAAATPEARAAQAVQAAREELAQRAGGTAVVDAASYASGRASTTTDALAYAPGVLAQMRHGPETRLSIRGSGVQRGYLMRGIQLYQDGIPLNQADGAADFQSIDPLAAQHIEVWRGANALEYGASSLGGAINFVSPTGLTAPAASARLQAGSFGQRLVQAQLAGRGEQLDGLLNISRSEQDGWREQSAWRTQRLSGNVGLRLTEALELRAFLSHVDADMQMPGSLTRAAMLADPRQAAPGYVAQNAGNNYSQTRGALRMDWQPREGLRWTTSIP
jgi:iron complex outermembrane receptor protein